MRPPRLYASYLLATILVAYPLLVAADDDDGNTPTLATSASSRQESPSNPHGVRLTPPQLARSGLQLAKLASCRIVPDIRLPARILELQPLLEQRANYRSSQADLTAAKAAQSLARKNRDRLSKLHQESIVATRELIQSEAQYAAENARLQSAEARFQQNRELILQTWGPELFRILTEDHGLFEQLLSRKQMLGLLSVPPGQRSPDISHGLQIQPAGQRGDATTAKLLGPAPRTDDATQAETWYFLVPAGRLRTGMRLDASLLQSDAAGSGVAIPKSAVIWHGGTPWVFVKTTTGEFSRFPVGPHQDATTQWLVLSGFEAGQEIVVQGAQMLLSHELKGEIPDEDDD